MSGTSRSKGEALADVFAILEGLPDATVASDSGGTIVFVNGLAGELFGFQPDELVGKHVQTLWPERVRRRYTRNMELYFSIEHPLRFSAEVWGLKRDGTEFMGEMSWGIVETATGPLLLAIGRDVSERRAAESRLRAVAALGERALESGVRDDLVEEAVETLRRALPLKSAEVGPGDDLVASFTREITDDESSFVRAVATILGTALARLRSEERMRHEALHDPLTGLANRTLLRDRLEHALARTERESAATGVLFVDLDDFKRINDRFGHAAGDAVLTEVAARLRGAVRPADTVARYGGDEFVVVCEEIDEDRALALARRLDAALRKPLPTDGETHRLTASIGIALGRGDPEALLARADAAVYQAKAAGRGRIEVRR
jgi:diguanylate cyclase (GGDEF)-like protein/PAS domain S-box-containing protein